MTEKKLNYITVLYDCSDELANKFIEKFDIEENENCFISINVTFSDNYYINFKYYYSPKFKKLIFINLTNIRYIYKIKHFNWWFDVISMFDEIYDLHNQLNEYKPNVIEKVKLLKISACKTPTGMMKVYFFSISFFF